MFVATAIQNIITLTVMIPYSTVDGLWGYSYTFRNKLTEAGNRALNRNLSLPSLMSLTLVNLRALCSSLSLGYLSSVV